MIGFSRRLGLVGRLRGRALLISGILLFFVYCVVQQSRTDAVRFEKPLHPNLTIYRNKHFSQIGQDKLVAELLHGLEGGFFVESGAYDGVSLSNTLFFEASKGWKGVLIEANPTLYRTIITNSNRTCMAVNACISPVPYSTSLEFRLAGPIGGLVSHFSDQHSKRVAHETGQAAGSDNVIRVPCRPLHAVLNQIGVTRVDYWSLDTEGSEADILSATDFDKLDIQVITVEVNDAAAEAKVKAVMAARHEFKLHSKIDFDLVYIKNNSM